MRLAIAGALSLSLLSLAAQAWAQEMPRARFTGIVDSVFGAGNWRLTGEYRTPEREDQLRAEGARTTAPGTLSRHSMGRPGASGAYDVVVDGLTPWQAAARLRAAGVPFAWYQPKGSHGSQGPHLHIEPFRPGAARRAGSQGPSLWIVAEASAEHQLAGQLRQSAAADDAEAQLALGRLHAESRGDLRDLVASYVWTARAQGNPKADPQVRQAAAEQLAALRQGMNEADLAYAQRFEGASFGLASRSLAHQIPTQGDFGGQGQEPGLIRILAGQAR